MSLIDLTLTALCGAVVGFGIGVWFIASALGFRYDDKLDISPALRRRS